jgi:hypothetical protein
MIFSPHAPVPPRSPLCLHIRQSQKRTSKSRSKLPESSVSGGGVERQNPALLANEPGWLTELQGKKIAATGTTDMYEGKTEIVMKALEDVNS